MKRSMLHNFGVDEASNMEDEYISRNDLNRYSHFADEIFIRLQKLDKQVNEVEQFYKSTNVQANKGCEKPPFSSKKPPLYRGPTSREFTISEETQEVMRQFSKILHEITQHEWAWPFLEPVDVEGLKLDNYHEIIKKPMDFRTIKRKMEARDGSGYKNVREIYADVRLIFTNAMTYNDEDHDVHNMAKTLLERFEKKWLQLLPKVYKAESGLQKEEAHKQLDKQPAQQANYANTARELGAALSEVEKNLKNLKAMMIGKCRKLSAPERVILGTALSRLSGEDLNKALKIVCENDPNFQPHTQLLDVDLDLDSQSDYIVWRLNHFVKSTLEARGKIGEEPTINHINNNIIEEIKNNNAKRRKLI